MIKAPRLGLVMFLGLAAVAATAACTIVNTEPKPGPDAGPGTDAGPDAVSEAGVTGGTLVFAYVDAPRDGGFTLRHLHTLPFPSPGGSTPATPKRITNTDADGHDSDAEPQFSVDGKQIVFERGYPDFAGPIESLRIINTDGTGEREIAKCGFTCFSPFFDAEGNVWFLQKGTGLAGEAPRLSIVPKGGGKVTDWTGDFAGCLIRDLSISMDGTTVAVRVDNAFNEDTCTAEKQGLYVFSSTATSLPAKAAKIDSTLLRSLDDIANLRLNKAKDRVYFAASLAGSTYDPAIFSAKIDGSDVKVEERGPAEFALSRDGESIVLATLGDENGSFATRKLDAKTTTPVLGPLPRLSFPAVGQ